MRKLLALTVALFAVGCATAHQDTTPSSPMASNVSDQALKTSSIQIKYSLGHARRQITMLGDGNQIAVQCFMDDQKLKQTSIDVSRYGPFFTQVRSFVDRQLAASAASGRTLAACVSPYTIEIKSSVVTEKVEGCRVMDQGAFAHLVKDAEFLVYRQK